MEGLNVLYSKTVALLKEGMTAAEYVNQAGREIVNQRAHINTLLNQLDQNNRLDAYDTSGERTQKMRRDQLHRALVPIATYIQDSIHDQASLTRAQEQLDAVSHGFTYSYYGTPYTIAPRTDSEKGLVALMRTLAATTYNYKVLMAMDAPLAGI